MFVLGAVGIESLTEFEQMQAGRGALPIALPSIAVLGLAALAGLVLQFVAPAAVTGACTSVALIEYFETIADPTVLPDGKCIHGGTTDTGAFEFGTTKDDSDRF